LEWPGALNTAATVRAWRLVARRHGSPPAACVAGAQSIETRSISSHALVSGAQQKLGFETRAAMKRFDMF
jgi:hypothetical protein